MDVSGKRTVKSIQPVAAIQCTKGDVCSFLYGEEVGWPSLLTFLDHQDIIEGEGGSSHHRPYNTKDNTAV